jgi:hypothetical protein
MGSNYIKNAVTTKKKMLQGRANLNKKFITNKILEQVKTFNILGCNLPYDEERDLNVRNNYSKPLNIIN